MLEYMFLWICVLLFIPWALIYFPNKHLRSRMLKAGVIAIPFGVVDMWFRIDYWHAPEVLFWHVISFEDVLFGFFTTGICVSIYDAIFTKKQVQTEKAQRKISMLLFPLIIISFFVLNNGLGLNSMFMWAIPMAVAALVIIIFRRDLLIPSIVTASLMTLIAIPIYKFLNYCNFNEL